MTDWNILFDSTTNFVILLLVVSTFSYSTFKLNRRQASRPLSYRIFFSSLNLIFSLSVLGLLLQPSFPSSEPTLATIYIANQGNLPKELKSNEYLYLKDDIELDYDYLARYRQNILYQPEQVLLKQPTLKRLLIIGDGLLPSQLAQFHQLELSMQPNPVTTGVIFPSWQPNLDAGSQLEFSATFQSADQSIYRVKLINPAQQVEDEVSVINGDNFVLNALPKVTGNHLYQLVISDQTENVVSEQSIPIVVNQSTSAKILIVQSAPSFESKHIQNWAGEMGAEILIRTRISKDKFMTRSTNFSQTLKSKPQFLISEKALAQFDVLILDGREWQFFDQQEINNLAKAVKDGLGIVVRTDGSLSSEDSDQLPDLLSRFGIKPITQNIRVDLIAHNQLDDSRIFADSVLLSAEPLFNIQKSVKHLAPLIVTPQGYVVVAQKHYGLGKITLSVIKQSHQLRTSSQARAHSQLWSHIIGNTARTYNAPAIALESEMGIILQNHKIDLCSESDPLTEKQSAVDSNEIDLSKSNIKKKEAAEIRTLNLSSSLTSVKVDLRTTRMNSRKHCGSYWPSASGWQKVIVSGIERYFYVHPANSWLAAQQNARLNATQTRIATWNPATFESNQQKPINDWYYWLLIVVCTSLIWIERKFWSNQ